MKKIHSLFAMALLAHASAHAVTGYYLVTTYPNAQERTIDFKYWKARPSNGVESSSPEIGYGYGVNSRWYTEVIAAWYQRGPAGQKLAAFEWQNDFMLTQGEYPFDLALHTTIERHEGGEHETGLQFGPVFQTEIGRTQLNLNVFFDREFHLAQPEPTEISYQWQVRYHYLPKLHVGAQGFGEMGPWNHWLPREKQSHRAGPALFGSWDLGGAREWRYEAAYLVGKNSGRSAKSICARIQYAF